MENPLLPCKPNCQIPVLITPPSKTHQSNPLHPPKSSPAPSQPPWAATHNTRDRDRQLNSLGRNGKLQEAILALEHGPPVRPGTYISLLQSCIDSESIDQGRRLHASIGSVQELNPYIETKLVSMYAKCGSLEEARQVFDGMRERNLFTWSAMINGCVRQQRWEEVVELFYQMMKEGVIPDVFLLPRILQACANTDDLGTGSLIHSLATRGRFLGDNRVSNSMLAMYAKCGRLVEAKRFFEQMDEKDLVTWNSIISGYCQCGLVEEALRLFEQMRAGGIEPSIVTWNILVASYNQSGKPELAMELMKQMERSGVIPDVFTWTSMISGLAQIKKRTQALDLFHEMQLSGVEPNDMTIASSISACASLKNLRNGRELHSHAVKMGGAGNGLVINSLIDMYSKCGSLVDAWRVFDSIQEKDVFAWNSMIGGYMQAGYCGKAYDLFSTMEDSGVCQNVVTWNLMISGYMQNGNVEHAMELFQRMETDRIRRNTASWNALITGFLQNGLANEALGVFRKMQAASGRLNPVTILSILPACGNLVAAWKVKEIHACILHHDLQSNTSIGNALVDTYSKSGDITSARAVFRSLSLRDIVSWNTMIAASVLHGCSQAARDLFCEMKLNGVEPDSFTLACVINAYRLSSMVNEGKELFSSMISPGLEHYRGMVNLFGHSGRLGEASEFIKEMPVEPDFAIWESLLTAARVHGNVKILNLAAESMARLESGNRMDSSNVRNPSSHGCSWLEIKKKVHTFLTGEKPAESSESKYLRGIVLDIEEEKEEIVGIHSEKLAIGFALANTPAFRRIPIIKSVRMCRDCHAAAKLVSKVHRREILLKDPKCLHSFKDGKCSCRDYW